MVTLDLTITNVNAVVNVVGNSTLQAQSVIAGTIYQWVDCNDNFAPIAGETNATFTTQNSGYYAVEVSLNNCSVISDCFTISSTAIIEASINKDVIMITDILGRSIAVEVKNQILFYIYEDGTIEKKVVIE
jgi:hypothetical protein